MLIALLITSDFGVSPEAVTLGSSAALRMLDLEIT
jgi:hypothetical protein